MPTLDQPSLAKLSSTGRITHFLRDDFFPGVLVSRKAELRKICPPLCPIANPQLCSRMHVHPQTCTPADNPPVPGHPPRTAARAPNSDSCTQHRLHNSSVLSPSFHPAPGYCQIHGFELMSTAQQVSELKHRLFVCCAACFCVSPYLEWVGPAIPGSSNAEERGNHPGPHSRNRCSAHWGAIPIPRVPHTLHHTHPPPQSWYRNLSPPCTIPASAPVIPQQPSQQESKLRAREFEESYRMMQGRLRRKGDALKDVRSGIYTELVLAKAQAQAGCVRKES